MHEVISKIEQAKISFEEESWNGISKEAKDLVKQLLEKDPELRIDSEFLKSFFLFFIFYCKIKKKKRLALMHPWINK